MTKDSTPMPARADGRSPAAGDAAPSTQGGAWARVAFGNCVVHRSGREVRVGGVAAPIEPRAFDVLCYLIDHRHRSVPKHDLLFACWGDDPPSDGALARAIMKVRQAIGDLDEENPLIKTVHRVGYRFVGGVTLDADIDAAAARSQAAPARDLDTPDATASRRLVILPFTNLTGDASLCWIELGLIAILARALMSVPQLSIVPTRDVLSALTGSGDRDAVRRRLEIVDQALGPSPCVWCELHGTYGRWLLHYNLRTSGHEIRQGTVVGTDPVGMVAEAASQLRAWMTDPGTPPFEGDRTDLGEPFLNEVFARGVQRSSEGRLVEAEHLFDVLRDAGVTDLGALYESTRVTVALARTEAPERLRLLGHAVAQADNPRLSALYQALQGTFLEARGEMQASVEATLAACEAASSQALHDLSVRLMVIGAGRMSMSADERAEGLLSKAIPLAERLGNRVVLCDAYCTAARVAGFRGDWATALRHQAAAVSIARTMHEASKSWAYGGLSWVLTSLGQLNAAAESAGVAFRSAKLSGAQPQQGLAAGQAALAYIAKRRITDLQHLFVDLDGLQVDGSLSMTVARDVYCRSTLLALAGDTDDALRIVSAVEAQAAGHPRLLVRCRSHRLAHLLRARQFDALAEACHALGPAVEQDKDGRLAPLVAHALAFCEHLRDGRTGGALTRLHATIDGLLPSEVHAAISLDAAWLHLERQELHAASALLLPLHNWLEQSPAGVLVAARWRYEQGDYAQAVAWQQSYLREYDSTATETHREWLSVYEGAQATGTRAPLPALRAALTQDFALAASVCALLPASLAPPA